MKKKTLLSLLVLIIFCFNVQAFGYTKTDEYIDYIASIDISYEDLNLTEEEISAIEYLQQNGGITYGIYENEEPVRMVFEQIGKIFDIEVIEIPYDNFSRLIDDLENGRIDFTSNILPTEERMELYSFTFSTIKEKIFLFGDKGDYIKYYISPDLLKKEQVIVYPEGFVIDTLIEDSLGKIFDVKLITAKTAEEAAGLVESGKVDIVICTIPWFEEIYGIDNYVGIDYTDKFNMYFSGSITKKGEHEHFISAINKLYVETTTVLDLQGQVDKYYEYEILNIVNDNHEEVFDYDKTYRILASEYLPYIYKENGQLKGLMIELIDEIFKEYDIKYEIVLVEGNLDYLLSEEEIKANNIDMILPMLATEGNMLEYNLTLPVVESDMTIITKSHNNITHLTKIEDFNIKRIGAVDSYFTKEYISTALYSDQYVTYYDDIGAVINAIENDEIGFGLVPYESFNKYAIENNTINIVAIKDIQLPTYKVSIGMRKTEEGEDLSLLFSTMIDTMELNYRELEKKYLSSKSEVEVIYENRTKALGALARTIFYAAISVIALLVFITFNNNKRANTDYLTKLRNRSTLKDYIKSNKNKKGMAMVYLDLDNFKIINDVYGHHYGDAVLRYVADKLKHIGKYSKSFRIGGDEFIMIYSKKHVNLDNIKNIFGNKIKIENTEINVEGSIGNIDLDKYGNYEVEEIINLVDYAMLRAKRKGKNTVVEIDYDLVNDFFIINEIRASLEKGIDESKIEVYSETIREDGKRIGIKLLPKYHFKDMIINYDEIKLYSSNKVILDSIDYLVFEKLCKLKNELTLKGYDTSKMYCVHSVLVEKIHSEYMNKLIEIMEKYDIDEREIVLNLNTNIFSINEGEEYFTLLNKINSAISINLFNIKGNSLAFFKYLNIKMIEIDVEELLHFFRNFEFVNSIQDVQREFEESVLIKVLYAICNNYDVNILLHVRNTNAEKQIISLIEKNVNTKIHYCEKGYVKRVDGLSINIDETEDEE